MKRILAAVLTAALALAWVGCGKEQMPVETTDATASAATTTAETTAAETTVPIETAEPQITVAPSSPREIEALPADPESAIITASPVGGNPTFYIFEAGLTYYVCMWNDSIQREPVSLSECVLALPEGYTDGRIAAASGGAGSGEVIFTVSAQKDGAVILLDYLFYCDDLADPVYIWAGETTPIRP